jgi:hypothetical protein
LQFSLLLLLLQARVFFLLPSFEGHAGYQFRDGCKYLWSKDSKNGNGERDRLSSGSVDGGWKTSELSGEKKGDDNGATSKPVEYRKASLGQINRNFEMELFVNGVLLFMPPAAFQSSLSACEDPWSRVQRNNIMPSIEVSKQKEFLTLEATAVDLGRRRYSVNNARPGCKTKELRDSKEQWWSRSGGQGSLPSKGGSSVGEEIGRIRRWGCGGGGLGLCLME